MKNLLTKIEDNTEFMDIVKDLIENKSIQEMKNFKQHYETSCFEHCFIAAYYSYLICKKLNLDYVSAARASMVHDLFLYDWRKRQSDRKGLHAFTHPKTAYLNASKIFSLNKIEKDIILKHMWPVTLFSLPKYRESFVLVIVDKYCALNESFTEISKRLSNKKSFRYVYMFLCLLFVHV